MNKVGKITNTWKAALEQIENGNVYEAIESLDKCLLILAMATEDNEAKLDGVKIDTWKVRVWVKLEELNAVPEYDDYI
jgi:DNA polymerase III delta prime subunit